MSKEHKDAGAAITMFQPVRGPTTVTSAADQVDAGCYADVCTTSHVCRALLWMRPAKM